MSSARERDYVLGTGDEEIERLGLQHRVWRPRALDAWRRAGFTVGQTLLDVGAGPGYATLDLAGIVGTEGRVIALDRSRRFLDVLKARAEHAGLSNVTVHEQDLDEGPLPAVQVDGAWCRWVLAFVKQPRALLERLIKTLKPGARLVSHEYFDYGTWRLMPRVPEQEEFVQLVIRNWRKSGGEPDIALDLPRWMEELGMAIVELRTLVDVVSPDNYIWQWPASFVHSGVHRFVELGELSRERGEEIVRAYEAAARRPGTRMVTPAVLEIVAVRGS
jgi:SAM-dependent methyltransferase